MRLFIVYNGYSGETAISVLVVAPDAREAKERARLAYKRDAVANPAGYTPDYWARMEVVELCPDTSVPWTGEVG